MSATDRNMQFAMLVKGLQDLDREAATWKADWKARRTVLEEALAKLSGDVLSGQLELVVPPENAA